MRVTMMGWALVALTTLAAADRVDAGQAAAPPCPAIVSAEFAGWSKPVSVAPGGMLAIGAVKRLALKPSGGVSFEVAPAKRPATDTFSGVVRFNVAKAATYRVALAGPAWVDVVQGGKVLTSLAHAHGPACSPVKKMVDFMLPAGRYALQLSGAKTSDLAVSITMIR
ncbi:hypothetical protein [Sphingomonas sp. R86520]|uniref:hypothetical protein n=1 Tax=Sphingomonas sp. R86520 TaxID=3093859 RepID=UPI0036D2F67F